MVATDEGKDIFPTVYSFWWHPLKCWKDIFLTWIMSFQLPLRGVQPEKDKKIHEEHVHSLRSTLQKLVDSDLRKESSIFHRWSAILGCDLVRVNIQVNRNDELHKKWGLLAKDEDVSLPADTTIVVRFTFPVTMLPESLAIKLPAEKNEYGWYELQEINILNKIPKDIPIIVYFHGGAMILGSPESADILLFHNIALQSVKNPQEKPVVVASVKYRLAPEHPFPAAPMECISVVNEFLDQDRMLHLAGTSAGGTLAMIAGLEALRAHPKAASNIRSIFCACPMIHPAADSLSMYQNSESAFVSVDFLRWCFQLYLELPMTKGDSMPLDNAPSHSLTLDELLGKNSNRQAWNASKWRHSSLRRLADPTLDIPQFDTWPKIFLTTNAGDPLLDDGLDLLDALQNHGAQNISYHAHMGTHWFGTVFDSKSMSTLAADWKDFVLT